MEDWDIAIDGRVVGSIAKQETVEVVVTPGGTRSGWAEVAI